MADNTVEMRKCQTQEEVLDWLINKSGIMSKGYQEGVIKACLQKMKEIRENIKK